MIPGAITAGTPEVVKKDQVCGNKKGLVTATNGDAKTICCRQTIFSFVGIKNIVILCFVLQLETCLFEWSSCQILMK